MEGQAKEMDETLHRNNYGFIRDIAYIVGKWNNKFWTFEFRLCISGTSNLNL